MGVYDGLVWGGFMRLGSKLVIVVWRGWFVFLRFFVEETVFRCFLGGGG